MPWFNKTKQVNSGGGAVPSNVILFEDWVDGEQVIIDTSPSSPNDVTAPTLTITPGGTFSGTKSITMTTNETATIYYTLDGSTPTTGSAVYTNTLTISDTTTIKAFAIDSAGNQSALQTITYTFDPQASTDTTPPVLTLTPAGTFTTTQTITMSTNETASIYYTVDGSDPVTSGTKVQYSSPITLSATTTVKAYAVDTAGNASAVQSVTYTKQSSGQTVIYPENGYLVMPVNQFTWGALTGFTDTGYIGVATSAILTTPSGFFDITEATDPILSDEYPYRDYVLNMPNSSYPEECSTVVQSGSPLGRAVFKVSTVHGATATDVANYLANSDLIMKLKLGTGFKTLNISSNISNVTTRTSGVDTTKFEYIKCTLNDGIGGYVPSGSVTARHFASNGLTVLPTSDYVFSRSYANLRVNTDGTLEMLLPKGTLTSMDLAGVIEYLANTNLKIFYA